VSRLAQREHGPESGRYFPELHFTADLSADECPLSLGEATIPRLSL
jgi:hypothetical protein